jgi:hypothetical protein
MKDIEMPGDNTIADLIAQARGAAAPLAAAQMAVRAQVDDLLKNIRAQLNDAAAEQGAHPLAAVQHDSRRQVNDLKGKLSILIDGINIDIARMLGDRLATGDPQPSATTVNNGFTMIFRDVGAGGRQAPPTP